MEETVEDLLNEKKLMLSLELPDDKSVVDLGEDDITFELDLEELMDEPEDDDAPDEVEDDDDDAPLDAEPAEETYEDVSEFIEGSAADDTDEDLSMEESLGGLDDDEIIEIDENMLRQELARMRALFEGSDDEDQIKVEKRKVNSVTKEARKSRALKQQLVTAGQAIQQLKEQLGDLNLFNAKLLYANKLLQNENLTKGQKLNIIKSLDRAESLRETKLLYKSLLESTTAKQKVMNESQKHARLGSASRVTRSGGTPKAVPELDRWSVLAGLK
jgi:hypothetical protein